MTTKQITPLSEKITEELEKDRLQFNNKDGSIHHDGANCLSEFCPCFLHGKIIKTQEISIQFQQALKNFCEELKERTIKFFDFNNKLERFILYPQELEDFIKIYDELKLKHFCGGLIDG